MKIRRLCIIVRFAHVKPTRSIAKMLYKWKSFWYTKNEWHNRHNSLSWNVIVSTILRDSGGDGAKDNEIFFLRRPILSTVEPPVEHSHEFHPIGSFRPKRISYFVRKNGTSVLSSVERGGSNSY